MLLYYFKWINQTNFYILSVFPHTESNETRLVFYWHLLNKFFMNCHCNFFLSFIRKLIFSDASFEDYLLNSPQILSIWIPIISWPRALLGSSSRFSFEISLLLNNKCQGKFAQVLYHYKELNILLFFKNLLHLYFGNLNVEYKEYFIIQKHLQSWPIGFCRGYWICQLSW